MLSNSSAGEDSWESGNQSILKEESWIFTGRTDAEAEKGEKLPKKCYFFVCFCFCFLKQITSWERASLVVLVVKNLPAKAGDIRNADSIPGSGKSPGVGNGNLFQYSCLENSMDRGAWWAAVHGIAKSWTRLNAHTLLSFKVFTT